MFNKLSKCFRKRY